MVDYFASLGIARGLFIDEPGLKNAWHAAAARAAEPNEVEEIHRAYAVLREPARRIEHMLELHGRPAAGGEKPGARLFDLFFTVGAALKKADAVVAQIESAPSALQRAGLTPSLLTSLDALASTHVAVSEERSLRDAQLTTLAPVFPHLSDAAWESLASLGCDYAFLTKWSGEIQKRETRLQETLMGKIA